MSEIDFRNVKPVNSIFRESVMYIEHEEVKYTDANIENVKIVSTKFEQCIFTQNSREYLKSIEEEIITKYIFV